MQFCIEQLLIMKTQTTARLHIVSFLLVAFLLAACAKRQAPPLEEDMLYRVECFYQTHLDSARQILDTLNLLALSEKERAHYCLLRAKVNDGFHKYDDFDSLMQVAEKQFVGGKDKYFEAMTYWLLSRMAQMENKGDQFVLDYRLKALQSIKQCQHVDERFVYFSLTPTDEQNEINRLKYAIHQRLGMSYTNSGYHREGVEHLKLADQYYAERQMHHHRTITAFPLGMAYLLLGEYDSCLMYYRIGLQSAETIGDTAEASYYYNALSSYYLYCYETQHFENEEDGKTALHQAIAESQRGLVVSRLVNDPRAYKYQFELSDNISRAYFDLQQYDSCVRYGLMAEGMTNRGQDLTFIYKRLYGSYKALGNEANAAIYADKLLSASPDYGAEQKAIAEVKDEYDRLMELQRIENKHQTNRLKLYLLIAVLAIALLLLWLFVNRYRKNKEIEMLRIREAQHQLQSDLENAAQHSQDVLQKRAQAIFQSNEDDKLRRIMAEFDATYPKALANMKAACPDLAEMELQICVLGFLGFRGKETALLIGVQENTIGKYRTTIRKKIGATDLKNLVRSHLE